MLITQKLQMLTLLHVCFHTDRVKRIWYLSPMRTAKVQVSLRIRAVSPEPSLLAHTSSESRGTFRQKARSLAPLNGWACAVKTCHDGMLEDTNSLDGANSMSVIWHLKLARDVSFQKKCKVHERIFEPHHEKTCFCHMRTIKAEISLLICVVWSAPLLFTA